MEKYNKCKPAIINAYFQTNLLAFIDKLPDDVKEGDTSDSESLPQESAEE